MSTSTYEEGHEAPTVAAIIPTYNRGHLIRETVDSILAQTRPPNSIVVVDDGSTDDTARVIAEYAGHVVYRHQSNKGKSAALNLALETIEADYVWIFDDDDIALPHAVESHLTFLQHNPCCDFTYSPGYRFSGSFSEQSLKPGDLQHLESIRHEDFYVYVLESMHVKMHGMLVPLRCYRALGGFDERLHRSQDHDMIMRLARRFRAGHVKEPTFAWRVHDGLRGPGFARHASADRAGVWRQYQNVIYHRLRDTLKLEEYLPGQAFEQPGNPTSLELRRALIQRAYIMAEHGLYAEAVTDLEEGLETLGFNEHGPTENENRIISHMVWIDDIENIAPIHFYRGVGRTAGCHESISRSFLRGFYWGYRRSGIRPAIHFQNTTRLAAFMLAAANGRFRGTSRGPV